jgi:benzodiazapine receptor
MVYISGGWSLIPFIGIPLLGGTFIGMSTRESVRTWFPTIQKPSWQPPNWIFGPMWTVLYTMMGISSHRIYLQTGLLSKPMFLYFGQLLLNFLWTPMFFGWHNLPAASIDITALLGVLGATIVEFDKYDHVSSKLLYPYLGWSIFAAVLTYNITMNNPSGSGDTLKAR